METIPKTQNIVVLDEKDVQNNFKSKKQNNGTIPNYEVTRESQKVSKKYKVQEPQLSINKKTKKAGGLKMFMEILKLLESLSPLFIKSTLKLILDFITDELSATKIFSNLAPVESKFLEIFLSICQRRNDLQDMLSPVCNDMLSEISTCFDNFSKTCCLDISTIGVNENTNQRDVKYTKVPVSINKKEKEKYFDAKCTNVTKTDTLNEADMPFRNTTVEQRTPKMRTPQDKSVPSVSVQDLSVLLSKMSISFIKEGTSNKLDAPYIRVEQKQYMKIVKDMTVPFTSEKALRMMLLMGWKGGALGLRGDGITEPIIPTTYYGKGRGLGYDPDKKAYKKKEVNKQKEKVESTNIRITKRRKNALCTEREKNKENIDTKVIHNLQTKAIVKTTVLKTVLELLQSENNEKVIHFHEDSKENLINFTNIIICKINARRHVKQRKILEVSELCSKIFKVIGDTLISIRIYEGVRCIMLKKEHPNKNGVQKNNQVFFNEALSVEDSKSLFENIINNLKTKKRMLLNALYQYEVEHPEEFKENQWYKTSDNSLLESKDALEDINNYTATINNNTDEAERINENKNNIDDI